MTAVPSVCSLALYECLEQGVAHVPCCPAHVAVRRGKRRLGWDGPALERRAGLGRVKLCAHCISCRRAARFKRLLTALLRAARRARRARRTQSGRSSSMSVRSASVSRTSRGPVVHARRSYANVLGPARAVRPAHCRAAGQGGRAELMSRSMPGCAPTPHDRTLARTPGRKKRKARRTSPSDCCNLQRTSNWLPITSTWEGVRFAGSHGSHWHSRHSRHR